MKTEWWKSFYDDNLASILLRPAEGSEAKRTSDFLIRELKLSPGATLFDQCCGNGRVSLPFIEKGFRVIGIDLAQSYIEEALSKLPPSATDCHFEAADAFLYQTPTPCDGAFNWWTSFGYAEEASQNLKMIQRAFDSLKPGTSFALDYMNVPGLYRHFQPEVLTEQDTPEGPLKLKRVSCIDSYRGRLKKDWHYTLPDGQTLSHQTETALYSPRELVTFFENAGFNNIRLFGDVDSSLLELDSPRAIICGTKP